MVASNGFRTGPDGGVQVLDLNGTAGWTRTTGLLIHSKFLPPATG
jgi:hypothetical protein